MFFTATPDFLYPDFKERGKFKLSKNLFRRVRTRDSFNAVYASSKQYTITPGETPDSIAYNKLGDGSYYWAILLLNNILDMQTQWPLSNDELDKHIEEVYGDLADKPRHWETNEIKDIDGNVVLEQGVIVEVFQNRPDQNLVTYYPKIRDQTGGIVSSFDIINPGSGYSVGNSIPTISVGKDLQIDITSVSSSGGITAAEISDATGENGVGYNVGDLVTVGAGNKNAVLKITGASSLEKNWEYTYVYSTTESYDESGNLTGRSVTYRTADETNLTKVTNREYETSINELKREIFIPTFNAVEIMEQEITRLLRYDTEYKITKEGYRLSEEV